MGLSAQRRLRWLASATFTAGVADGAVDVSLPLLVSAAGGDAVAISAVLAASYTGILLGNVLSGVSTDLYGPRPVALVAAGSRVAATALLLLALDPVLTLPVVYVCAVSFGASEAAAENAYASVLPMVFHDTHPGAANSFLYTAEATSRMLIGPLAGAASVANSRFAATALIGAAFALAYPLTVAATRETASVRPSPERESGQRVVSHRLLEAAAGLRTLLNHPVLRRTSMVAAIMSAASGLGIGPLLVFVQEQLGAGELGFGALVAVTAVGTTVGSLTARRCMQSERGRAVAVPAMPWVTAVALALLALVPTVTLAAAALAVAGVAAGMWTVISRTVRHISSPRSVLGRVNAAHRVLTLGAAAPSAILGGVAADAFGAATPIYAMAAGFAVAAAFLPRRALTALLRDHEP